MKAIRIHGRGGPDHLVCEDVPQPHPGSGEVLVRVSATGIIINELKWNETNAWRRACHKTHCPPEMNTCSQQEIFRWMRLFACF